MDFIAEETLVDVATPNSCFTWSNFREDPSCSRLDRFLVSIDWEDNYPKMEALTLARPVSGHKPILLKTSN